MHRVAAAASMENSRRLPFENANQKKNDSLWYQPLFKITKSVLIWIARISV